MIQAIPRDPGGQVVPVHQIPNDELLRIRCAEASIHFEALDLVLAAANAGQWAGQMCTARVTSEQLGDALGVAASTVRKWRATLPETSWLQWAATGRGYRVVIDLRATLTPDVPEPTRGVPEVFPAVPELTRSDTSCSELFSRCSVATRSVACCSPDVPSCSFADTFRPAADTGEAGTSVAHARASLKTSSLEEVKEQHAAASAHAAAAANSSSDSDQVVDEDDDAAVLTQDIVEQLKRHGYNPDPIVVSRCVVPDLFATGIDLAGARSYAAKKLDSLIEKGPTRYDRWLLEQLFEYLAADCAEWWLSEQSRRARVQAASRQPEQPTSQPDDSPFRKSSASYREKIAAATAAKRAREQAAREEVANV